MNKYGNAAIKAITLYRNGDAESPEVAWELATIEIFGKGTSAQKKSCPKGAFLGLCQEGLIKGIPKEEYTTSIKNKDFAVTAIGHLRKLPELAGSPNRLWNCVLNGEEKNHNQQMNVVIALWSNGFIVT